MHTIHEPRYSGRKRMEIAAVARRGPATRNGASTSLVALFIPMIVYLAIAATATNADALKATAGQTVEVLFEIFGMPRL